MGTLMCDYNIIIKNFFLTMPLLIVTHKINYILLFFSLTRCAILWSMMDLQLYRFQNIINLLCGDPTAMAGRHVTTCSIGFPLFYICVCVCVCALLHF